MPSQAGWLAAFRSFLAEEGGGAGTEYVVFATCWALAVSAGIYFTGNVLTGKFEAVGAALNSVNSAIR